MRVSLHIPGRLSYPAVKINLYVSNERANMIAKKRMELLTQVESRIILNRNRWKDLIATFRGGRDSKIGKFQDHLLFFSF